ncbi:MAG: glycosyltransferase [Oscillatoria sp. PMC 1068.18]|nr:glycosyltransferase [Oscillatoria sp. PMC 1076.18]MEC4989711.1 glycosyltransferase [Oscillatoria sp. PMC 1068.18]
MLQIERGRSKNGFVKTSLFEKESKPLVNKLPLTNCEICVIIPVRDEGENIEATLTALAQQKDFEGKQIERSRYEILILANNCTDNSAAIARRFANLTPGLVLHVVERTLPPFQAYVGKARQLLMDEAYRRLQLLGKPRGIIASTDGDTKVTQTWLAAILQEINRGVDAVGGRIIAENCHEFDLTTKAYYLRYSAYQYLIAELEGYLNPQPDDPLPRHNQFCGASLAVTAEMYARVGGLPAVRTPEDVALGKSLRRFDAKIRYSPKVKVFTSARQIGRANVGMANRLSQLAAMGRDRQKIFVESPVIVETRFLLHRLLRQLWGKQPDNSLFFGENLSLAAQYLAVKKDWLAEAILFSPTYGILLEKIAQEQQEITAISTNCLALIEIESAISKLRSRLAQLRIHPTTSLNSLEQIQSVFILPPSF